MYSWNPHTNLLLSFFNLCESYVLQSSNGSLILAWYVPFSYILLIYYQLFVIDLYIWHLTMYKYVISPNLWFLISVLNIESKKNFNILEKNRCFYLMLYKHLCVREHRNPWTKNLLFLRPYSKKFLFLRIALEIDPKNFLVSKRFFFVDFYTKMYIIKFWIKLILVLALGFFWVKWLTTIKNSINLFWSYPNSTQKKLGFGFG